MPSDIASLIARCEAAEGPDRELDLAIELHLEGAGYAYPADNWQKDVSAYTASLDAAMSLVPEGWSTANYHQGPSGGGHWWELGCIRDDLQQYLSAKGRAATPALALTAACLRAMQDQAK